MKPTVKNFVCIASLLLATTCCHAQFDDPNSALGGINFFGGWSLPKGPLASQQNYSTSGFAQNGSAFGMFMGVRVNKLRFGFAFQLCYVDNTFNYLGYVGGLASHGQALTYLNRIAPFNLEFQNTAFGLYDTYQWKHLFAEVTVLASIVNDDGNQFTYSTYPDPLHSQVVLNETNTGCIGLIMQGGIGLAINYVSVTFCCEYLTFDLKNISGTEVYTDNTGANSTYTYNYSVLGHYLIPYISIGVRFPKYDKEAGAKYNTH